MRWALDDIACSASSLSRPRRCEVVREALVFVSRAGLVTNGVTTTAKIDVAVSAITVSTATKVMP